MASEKTGKISIIVLEGSNKGTIEAQYNPQEISFDKSVNWSGGSEGVGTDYPSLMFTAGSAVTMNLELLFDKYEASGDQDVRPTVKRFVDLCMIDPDIHRPPQIRLCWGSNEDVLGLGKAFTGVIEKASAKYTMFTSTGTPCRATVSVSMKQADDLGYQGTNSSGKSFVHMSSISSAAQLNAIPGAKEAAEAKGIKVDDPNSYPIENLVIEEKSDESGENQ